MILLTPRRILSAPGYQLVHLNLSAVDAAEMQRAYLADDTPVQSVPLSDVYKVITGHGHASQTDVHTLHRERINAWRNKRFFSVPSPEGDTHVPMDLPRQPGQLSCYFLLHVVT